MMLPKTYHHPGSETLATFAFASLGGALAVGAVGVLDASLLLYPAYDCRVNGATALDMHQRRRSLRRGASSTALARWPAASPLSLGAAE